jgi:hypothetical protein
MRGAANKRLQLEVTLIKAIQNLGSSNLSDVLAALGRAASGEEIPGDRGDQEGRPASSQSAPSQVASRRQPAGKSTSASARPPQQAAGLTTGSLEAQATPRRQSDAMERPPQAGFDPQLWNRLLQHPDLSTTTALALKNVEPKQRGDSVLTLGLAEHASGFERKLVQDALPRIAALLRSLSGVPWALEIGDTAARKSDAETATPASESDPDRDDDPLIEAAIRKFAATIESRPVRPPIS